MNGNWKKFIGYYRPHLGLLFADLFFAVLGAVMSLALPLVIRYITNTVLQKELSQALQTIFWLTLLMLVMILVEFYCNYFIAYYGHMMGARMEYAMRQEIFTHYQKLSFGFFDNHKVGHLMSRVTNDLFDISELFHHGPEDLFISIIKLAGAFLILWRIKPILTLGAFAIIPFMVVYAIWYNKKMKRAFKQNRARISDINAQIEDNLSGIRVVKSFANEDIEMDKFTHGNQRFLESKGESYQYLGMYHAGLNAFTTLISVVVVSLGAYLIAKGQMETIDLITFFLYIGNFTEPIKKLINFTEQFQNGASGFSRFMEIIEIAPEIQDAPDAVNVGRLRGEITFQQVSFAYKEGNAAVLSNVDLQIAPGEYVALVGPSGVGKTTLCNLIPRFYDVSTGRISIDGMDIRKMTQKSLREQIGMVQQDVYLFAGNIMENIRYGRPDATDEEVREAAIRANAHAFIMALPQGYETDIGQRGVKLSGGQKQRLSIARVFLKNPPILIFDEATSALDNESEHIVQASLEELARDRTTLVIAHRLSTIRNAKRILVLSEEGIAESGTHDSLLKKNGLYARLYQLQFKAE